MEKLKIKFQYEESDENDYELIELDLPADVTKFSKVLYEDDIIRVKTTGQNYDFIATVENKTNEDIYLVPSEFNETEDCWAHFSIESNGWVGLLADVDGYFTLNALVNNKFSFVDQYEFELF